MLLNIIMRIFFCAVTNLFGSPIGAIGQNIADPFAPDDFIQQIIEFPLVVGRHIRHIIVG